MNMFFGKHSHNHKQGCGCKHSHAATGPTEKVNVGFNDDDNDITLKNVVIKSPSNATKLMAEKQEELMKKQIELAKKKANEVEQALILDSIAKKDYTNIDAVKAAQFGVLERLKELVDNNKCDPKKPDSDNVYLLHWAAYNNRVEIADYLLSLGCYVDSIGGELETTPLNWAARAGHVEVIAFLIKNGADPNARDSDGYAAIHLATMFGHSIIVAYLLAKGVDVCSVNKLGKRILIFNFC